MVRARKARGLTLIELLLSMAILTLLVGLGTFSFSAFSRKWSDLENISNARAAELRRVVLLRECLDAAVPWKIAAGQDSGYYFLGDSFGFTMVSEKPIFERHGSAVVRVLAERESGGNTWRLAYEEASLSDDLLTSVDQELPFKHRLIVLSGIRQLSFQFLGWRLAEQRFQVAEIGDRAEPEWLPRFDGIEARQQPLAVRINFDSDYAVVTLPDRTEEWESGEVVE